MTRDERIEAIRARWRYLAPGKFVMLRPGERPPENQYHSAHDVYALLTLVDELRSEGDLMRTELLVLRRRLGYFSPEREAQMDREALTATTHWVSQVYPASPTRKAVVCPTCGKAHWQYPSPAVPYGSEGLA